MRDLQGRPYAKVIEVVVGTILIPDGDFTCMKKDSEKVVKQDKYGLYIDCSAVRHHLDGQLDETGTFYVGLYLKDGNAYVENNNVPALDPELESV